MSNDCAKGNRLLFVWWTLSGHLMGVERVSWQAMVLVLNSHAQTPSKSAASSIWALVPGSTCVENFRK